MRILAAGVCGDVCGARALDAERLGALVGSEVRGVLPMGRGVGGTLWRAALADGTRLVVKCGGDVDLRVEGRMLGLLAGRGGLPTPRVWASERDVLVMDEIASDGRGGEGAEEHAAELLARLHGVVSQDGRYGLEEDNFIGALPQANGWCDGWVEFFRARRIGPMLARARRAGAVGAGLGARVEALAARLGELVPDRPRASLMHGDVWGGNVLVGGGRVAAFIDPSPYHGHAEVELAFITLFGTFGERFFEVYAERAGWGEGERREFWGMRRGVYNVYPLLVHCALFGSGYAGQLEGVLRGVGL